VTGETVLVTKNASEILWGYKVRRPYESSYFSSHLYPNDLFLNKKGSISGSHTRVAAKSDPNRFGWPVCWRKLFPLKNKITFGDL
jgi:hypothetical protein